MVRTEVNNTPWRSLAALLAERRWFAVAIPLVTLPASFCESAVLVLVAEIAGTVVQRQRMVSVAAGPFRLAGSIDRLLVISFGLALIRIALQGIIAYLPARVLADAQKTMRERLVAAYMRAAWPVKAQESEGHLQELLTSQVLQATYIIQVFLSLLSTVTTLVVLIVASLLVGLIPALAVLAVGISLFVLLHPLGKLGSRQAQGLSNAQMSYADAVGETARLAEEAEVFGAGAALEGRLLEVADLIRERYFATTFLANLVPGIYYGTVLALLVGGLALVVTTGLANPVTLGASVLLLVRAANYGNQLQGGYQNWRTARPFLERLRQNEGVYRVGEVARGNHDIRSIPRLSFEGVSYSYGSGAPALRDVSFDIKPGETIGIVGPTGAGKSTLVQLLLGLREPTEGTYRIDGHPSISLSGRALTRAFAYVSQEPKLLHSTVAQNIAFFRDLDTSAIESAAARARIDTDIRGWSNGYDTLIGQRADAVSGGQRQRICLARALAGDPFVLVLDEPTSSLDLLSESLVQESLRVLRGTLTIFVVAHRLSTLTFCDRIMVIVQGRIEAFGPASDLMETDGFYSRATELHLAQQREGTNRFRLS